MTDPSSNIIFMNEGESKHCIVNKKLLQRCSTNENKSKHSTFNEHLLQNCSLDENELRSTKEHKSECAFKKQKYAKNEVTCDVTNYFIISNVFECGRKNLDVSCEISYIATEDNE